METKNNRRRFSKMLRKGLKQITVTNSKINVVIEFKSFRKSASKLYDSDIDVIVKGTINMFGRDHDLKEFRNSYGTRWSNNQIRRYTRTRIRTLFRCFNVEYGRLGRIILK